MSRWDDTLERLTRVRDDCLGKPKDEENKDSLLDDFTRQKKAIGKKIKKIREILKVRDNLLSQKLHEEVIKRSNTARIMISDVYADAEQLNEIHNKEKKKSQKKIDEDPGYKQLMANRTNIVKLIFTHIQECEMLEGQRERVDDENLKFKLFELKAVRPKDQETNNGDYGIVKLPDIEKMPDITVQEGFARQDANDLKIEQLLDQVLDGVIDLKELATAMGDHIETSSAIVEELNVNVKEANQQLIDVNLQLKKTLKKLRSPKKICFDICLIILFLGLIGLIVKVALDRS